MEEVKDYKNEIANTRVGCLGSSDGKMLSQIAALGTVPKSAYRRLAVVKGLIPQVEIPKNAAIQAGDDLEMIVYSHLKAQDPRYESNPLWVSKKYSTKNCKLISHPDLVLQDDVRKVLNVYEVKTTKYTINQTRSIYDAQLYIHSVLAKEVAKELGDGWTIKLFLVHYSTEGLDLTNGIEFDPSRLTIRPVRYSSACFDVGKAMNIVDAFLEDFTEYYEGDEVDANLLPEKVRNQITDMATILCEIKEREKTIEDFKSRLYNFMVSHGIKSLKSEYFSIVAVNESESKTFDAKKYLVDLKKKHPRKYKKIFEEYSKTQIKNGYCQIKIKKEK